MSQETFLMLSEKGLDFIRTMARRRERIVKSWCDGVTPKAEIAPLSVPPALYGEILSHGLRFVVFTRGYLSQRFGRDIVNVEVGVTVAGEVTGAIPFELEPVNHPGFTSIGVVIIFGLGIPNGQLHRNQNDCILLVVINPSRFRLLAYLVIVTPLGFATKFYTGPGAHWVESYLGGVLYVVFFILLALLARPTWPVRKVAVAVFLATSFLEILQLWHPVWLEGVRSSFLGHALLGNTFSIWDFPHYAVGAVIGCFFSGWAVRLEGFHRPG